ncbi:hypothetical protein TNCV_3210461 [Trichonephila clavipes]|nr:hypothetical protein TNCV_3210461 [Trichonephila clavipes]
MIVRFRNEKVSNHGSIPITIDCNVVAFIVFEEGFHQPIKRTKQITLALMPLLKRKELYKVLTCYLDLRDLQLSTYGISLENNSSIINSQH